MTEKQDYQHTYCVVDDVYSENYDSDGMPIPTGSVRILFDGGFDRNACAKWLDGHPDVLNSSPGVRVESYMEPE